jgi:hypothetical protein
MFPFPSDCEDEERLMGGVRSGRDN